MDKVKPGMLVIVEHTETALTLAEFCDICGLSVENIQQFIDYDIIRHHHTALSERVFFLDELQRVKTALRLQRDLELNLAGVAIVLDLLDELQELRRA